MILSLFQIKVFPNVPPERFDLPTTLHKRRAGKSEKNPYDFKETNPVELRSIEPDIKMHSLIVVKIKALLASHLFYLFAALRFSSFRFTAARSPPLLRF